MADTLTESFCERCGTRYEFTAPTRLNPLRKTRGLFGGLKNYLTSQDDLADAIGDAMRNEEGALASAQLEAFHESFNFCIDCRQYTCVNCWNDDAGRCRSCAPVAGTDDLAERLEASLGVGAAGATWVEEPTLTGDELDRRLGTEQWPSSDLPEPAGNGHVSLTESWPVAEAQAAPEGEPERFVGADGFVYETQAQADAASASLLQPDEPIAAAGAEGDQLVAEQAAEPDWEAVAAELAIEQAAAAAEPAALPPLRVVAWDEDAAYEVESEPVVAEVEPEAAAAEAAPEPEPVVAEVEPEPEPVVAEVEPEPEPVVAESVPEPEPAPAPRPIAPISETILHFPEPTAAPSPQPPAEQQPVAAEADTPELAARRAQLDDLGLGDLGQGPADGADPKVLPYRSRGAAATPAELAALAAQGARFWEASAREVASAVGNVGIQNCGECGLSLSANARFCRRCGTRQARSA